MQEFTQSREETNGFGGTNGTDDKKLETKKRIPSLTIDIPSSSVFNTRQWKQWSDDSDEEIVLHTNYDTEGDGLDVEYPNSPSDIEEMAPEEKDKFLASKLALEHEWVFWYDDRKASGTMDKYENAIRSLGKFSTIQDFWRYWNNLQQSSKFPDGTNLRLFKEGIKPMWEDPANKNGGKWVIQCHKESTHKVWATLVLSLIGEQFEYCDSLCGAVLSIRPKGDTINLWNRSGDNQDEINKTTDELKKFLGYQHVKYQLHQASIEKGSDRKTKRREDNHSRSKSLDLDRSPRMGRQGAKLTPSFSMREYDSDMKRAEISFREPKSQITEEPEEEKPKLAPKSEPLKVDIVVNKFSASPAVTPNATPSGTPSLARKRGWGDWSDTGFASSDESGASDREATAKKAWNNAKSPVVSLEVVVEEERRQGKEDVVHKRKPSLEKVAETHKRTPSIEKASETHKRTPSMDKAVDTHKRTPSIDKASETHKRTPSTDKTAEAHKRTPSLGKKDFSVSPESSPRNRRKGELTSKKNNSFHVEPSFTKEAPKEAPKFSSGRGAIISALKQGKLDLAPRRSFEGNDSEFIKQLEDLRNEQANGVFDDPEVVVETKSSEDKVNQETKANVVNDPANGLEATIEVENENESSSKKVTKSKTPTLKQQRIVQPAKKPKRPHTKKTAKEEGGMGWDYLFIALGLCVVLVLLYLYQTDSLQTLYKQ